MKTKYLLALTLFLVGIFLLLYYKNTNPYGHQMGVCYFRALTGYKCPGCGSQRSLYYLLNFQFINAIKENAFFVFFIFFFSLYLAVKIKIIRLKFLENLLQNPYVLYGLVFLMFSFWILRNMPFFTTLTGLK